METWFRLPRVLRVVGYAAGWFAVAFLVALAWDFDHLADGPDRGRLIGWAAIAGLVGLLLTPFCLGLEDNVRRDWGSIDRYIEYHRALRTGDLPTGVEPDLWRNWLRGSELTDYLAQFVAYAVLLLVAAPTLIYRPAYHPVAVGLLGLVALWRILYGRRKRARIARLTAEVEMHAQPGTEPSPEEEVAQGWFYSSSAARMAPVVVIGFSLAITVAFVDRLYNGDDGSLIVLLVWAAFVGLVPAASILVGNERNLSRNFGSLEHYNAYTQTLRTGELPAHIDPDAWRARLNRSRRLSRTGPVWIILLVLFGALPTLITHTPYWLTAFAFGLTAVMDLAAWWRRRREIARLTADIEQRSPGDSWRGLTEKSS